MFGRTPSSGGVLHSVPVVPFPHCCLFLAGSSSYPLAVDHGSRLPPSRYTLCLLPPLSSMGEWLSCPGLLSFAGHFLLSVAVWRAVLAALLPLWRSLGWRPVVVSVFRCFVGVLPLVRASTHSPPPIHTTSFLVAPPVHPIFPRISPLPVIYGPYNSRDKVFFAA